MTDDKNSAAIAEDYAKRARLMMGKPGIYLSDTYLCRLIRRPRKKSRKIKGLRRSWHRVRGSAYHVVFLEISGSGRT